MVRQILNHFSNQHSELNFQKIKGKRGKRKGNCTKDITETSLSCWLLLLSGNMALKTLGLSSKYPSKEACKEIETSHVSQHIDRERERRGEENWGYPWRLIERDISSHSWRVGGRIHCHLILDQRLLWFWFRQCMALPLMPIQLLFPFPWAKMSNKHLVLAWDKGPCCNFAHFLSATIVFVFRREGKPILLGFFNFTH